MAKLIDKKEFAKRKKREDEEEFTPGKTVLLNLLTNKKFELESFLPFAFASRFENGVILEFISFSPLAFVSEALSPEILTV